MKKFKFQTEEEANLVRASHINDLDKLSIKYGMTHLELFKAAENSDIADEDDILMIFKRSYILHDKKQE